MHLNEEILENKFLSKNLQKEMQRWHLPQWNIPMGTKGPPNRLIFEIREQKFIKVDFGKSNRRILFIIV